MTIGLILAGGRARRMGGGDKGLARVGGATAIERVIACLAPQTDRLVLNANGDPARFAPVGLPVVADTLPGHPGPLAGLLAGMDWVAAHAPETQWLLSAPADAPFLPPDLVRRLHDGRGAAPIACAASAGQVHHVIGLWPVAMRHRLRELLGAGLRKMSVFTQGAAVVEWPTEPIDPFFNLNTPEDLAAANRLVTPQSNP